jgi:hypothetical protein
VNAVSIFGNRIHDWGNWDDALGANHHDGIFLFAMGPGSAYNEVQVYNNILYGFIQTPFTAYIYMSTNGGTNNFVFNNVLYNTGPSHPANAYLFDYGTGIFDFNNTIVGPRTSNTGGNGFITYAAGSTLRNNVISTCYVGIAVNTGASLASSDYNDLYNSGATAYDGVNWYATLSNWQKATGFDTHSTNGNPLLSAGTTPPYQLSSTSSAAYQKGTNLTSYCSVVPALCTDAAGNARPATGAWDMGAYQYSTASKSGGAPNPPTALNAVVN